MAEHEERRPPQGSGAPDPAKGQRQDTSPAVSDEVVAHHLSLHDRDCTDDAGHEVVLCPILRYWVCGSCRRILLYATRRGWTCSHVRAFDAANRRWTP
jgi:LSD1 subclass zinc finger protein